jgi:hypothetical protein
MRPLALYLRSRQVPVGLAVAVVAGVLLAVLVDNTAMSAPLAIGFAVAVLGGGLGGPDPTLDRTAALAWAPRRLAHVLAIAIVGAATAAGFVPIGMALRDAAGLAGLAAFGAAMLGRQLAWCLPVAWAGAAAVVPAAGSVLRVLTWPAQPADGSPPRSPRPYWPSAAGPPISDSDPLGDRSSIAAGTICV